MGKRVCPHCAEIINSKLEICPICKRPVKNKAKGTEHSKALNDINLRKAHLAQIESKIEPKKKVQFSDAQEDNLNLKEIKNDVNITAEENISTTVAKTSEKAEVKTEKTEEEPKKEINISTDDVTYFEGITGNYSTKKAKAPVQEKLKWWEIYKFADRLMAKRKIMKVVNTEGRKRPSYVSKIGMILFCLLMGPLGIHNIYAKNYGKGFTSMGLFLASFGLSMLHYLKIFTLLPFTIGCMGFIVLCMWVWDLFNIIFNKFVYRTSKEKFIKTLNANTRAKLGKKYIDMV